MATVHVTIGAGERTRPGFDGIVMSARGGQSETVTSGGTSVTTTIQARATDHIAMIYPVAQTVAVVTGASPTASLASGIIAPADLPTYVAVATGDRIAVIDV